MMCSAVTCRTQGIDFDDVPAKKRLKISLSQRHGYNTTRKSGIVTVFSADPLFVSMSLKLGADRASMNHDTSFCTSFLLATRAEFRDMDLRASNHFSFGQLSKGVNSASCML